MFLVDGELQKWMIGHVFSEKLIALLSEEWGSIPRIASLSILHWYSSILKLCR